jgi:hypothetical protein
MRTIAIHLLVQPVSKNEVMGQLETVRFHRMRWTIVKMAYFRMIKVGYSRLCHVGMIAILSGDWKRKG